MLFRSIGANMGPATIDQPMFGMAPGTNTKGWQTPPGPVVPQLPTAPTEYITPNFGNLPAGG